MTKLWRNGEEIGGLEALLTISMRIPKKMVKIPCKIQKQKLFDSPRKIMEKKVWRRY